MSSETVQPALTPRRNIKSAGLVGAAIAILIVVSGIALRRHDARRLESWTDAQAVPTVAIVQPSHAAVGPSLILPARLEAYSRAPIFARVNGYLRSWNVDIGTSVKAGQVLAVIETPELDQQIVQAKADLATAVANASLAETTSKRWQAMLGTDAVAQQEVDERTGNYAARKAAVAAAQANVDRLIATKGFARIVAPFDGVVTSRETDVGALINAGSGGAGQELFAVSDVKRLRVYVQVPQSYSPYIRQGTTATLTVPEYPGQSFTASVVALAESIDARSGTSLVQLMVDNTANRLLPGSYASLRFVLPVPVDALRVPSSALVFNGGGLQLATLDSDNHVRFKKVTVQRDLGDAIEVGSGLLASDRVIDTPPDGLADGDAVHVAQQKPKVPAHG